MIYTSTYCEGEVTVAAVVAVALPALGDEPEAVDVVVGVAGDDLDVVGRGGDHVGRARAGVAVPGTPDVTVPIERGKKIDSERFG